MKISLSQKIQAQIPRVGFSLDKYSPRHALVDIPLAAILIFSGLGGLLFGFVLIGMKMWFEIGQGTGIRDMVDWNDFCKGPILDWYDIGDLLPTWLVATACLLLVGPPDQALYACIVWLMFIAGTGAILIAVNVKLKRDLYGWLGKDIF